MSRFAYRGNKSTTANTHLAKSQSIWYDCPWDSIMRGDVEGSAFYWDFTNLKRSTNINAAEAYWSQGLVVFGSDGAAIADPDALGGGATLSSDGDNEGVGIAQEGLPFQISQSHKTLWLEILLQTSTITDAKHGFVTGLIDAAAMSATVPIAAAGTLADENFVGFHRLEGDGDAIDTVFKADGQTQVTQDADAFTIAAATDFKLGLRFDPARDPYKQDDSESDTKYLVTWYKDGVPSSSQYQVTSTAGNPFPNDVRMSFFFALLNNTASTPGSTTIKKAWVAQLH